MTETARVEDMEANGFDIEAELKLINDQLLALVPLATEENKLSSREFLVDDGYSKIILASRKNESPYDSDLIVSKLISQPGAPLERETYRWTSVFPKTTDLQFYETVKTENEKMASSQRKGFDQKDVNAIQELLAAAEKVKAARG